MRLPYEEYVLDIAERVSDDTGRTFSYASVRWIERPVIKQFVADTTLMFFVDGRSRAEDIVLTISNPQYPDQVSRAVERSFEVADRLSRPTREHVLQPLSHGTYGKQSYAAYQRLCSLSSSRAVRYLQKKSHLHAVVDWLADLANETKKTPDSNGPFIAEIEAVAENTHLSAHVRQLASACLTRTQDRRAYPWTCVEHGDFWCGNILFEMSAVPWLGPIRGNFYVIDWGGSELKGYPGLDVVRYAMSLSDNQLLTGEILAQFRRGTGLLAEEMAASCLASLGRIGRNRGEFPLERYAELCERVCVTLAGDLQRSRNGKYPT